MDIIEKQRNKKLKEELANDLKIIKLQAEQRKYNEQKNDEDLGIQKSLIEFHKPVISKIEEKEESKIQNLKALQDSIDQLNFQPLEAIEDVKELYKEPAPVYNADQGLDIRYLKSLQLYRPSKLVNNNEKLDEMYAKAKILKEELSRKKGNIASIISRTKNSEISKGKNEEYNDIIYKEGELKKYLDRLSVIIGSAEMLIGKGLNDSLDILSNLTDKICNGSKSKKLYNQIVILLDMLLKDGKMTNENVKQYYKQFLS